MTRLGTIALLALALAGTAWAAAGRIALSSEVVVDGDRILLGDLGVLEGPAERFAEVDLGPAPGPGATRRLAGTAVLRQLRAAGLDRAGVRYRIPAWIRVRRASQQVSSELLRDEVRRALAGELRPGESVRAIDVARGVRIPPGRYRVRAGPLPERRGSGVFPVALEIVQEERVVARVPARVTLARSEPVVVVRRALPRGARVEAADVSLELRGIAPADGDVLRSLEDAIGKRTRIALAAGQRLRLRHLESPPAVRRGEVVRAFVERPGLEVSLAVEALESAAAGEPVRIRNVGSGRELSGRVTEDGRVRVAY